MRARGERRTRDAEGVEGRHTEGVEELEMSFFGFPKVKWLHLTGEVDKSVRFSCHIFSGFNIGLPKII